MKILMLTPFSPYPPKSGGRIRMWEQIKFFGQRHDLSVVTFAFSKEEHDFQEALETHCGQAILVRHPETNSPPDQRDIQWLPWPVRSFYVNEMRRTLEELRSNDFDVVLIDFIFMSYYRNLFSTLTVLQEHNIESNVFRQYAEMPDVSEAKIMGIKKNRLFWKATWMHMAEYENKIWPTFPLRVTVSSNDKKEMESRCPYGRTVLIENCVDTKAVTMVDNGDSRKILFIGTMNYYPNIDGALHLIKSIMPYIWHKDPTVSLCIAGLNPPRVIRDLTTDPRIEVIANFEDMREVAQRCCLTLVPLRLGGGTRIKILDSFALGLPVVSTSLGCEGLHVAEGKHLLIRDDPKQFADAVLEVISNPIMAHTLRTNGRRLVEERYDWKRTFEQLEREILSLVVSKAH